MSARKTGWIGATILAVGLCASFAEAATNTLVNGATDWRLPGSYAEANVDYTSFTSADVLQIPADATVYIDLSTEAGVASLAVLNSVERIVPLSTNSVLDVTVPEGTESAQINVPISYAHIDNKNTGIFNGELVKRGVGELALEPPGTKNNELQTKMTVKTGTLVLPQTCPNGQVYVSAITVDEGATLVTARNNANDAASPIANTVYKTLNGAGTITNRTPSSAGRTYALEAFSNNKSQCGTFTGKITGAIQVFNYGYVNLTGTESDCPGDFRMSGYGSNSSFATNYSNAMSGNYATHISKLANRRQPSSIGAVTNILVEATGHNLIYDGEGGDSSDVPFTI